MKNSQNQTICPKCTSDELIVYTDLKNKENKKKAQNYIIGLVVLYIILTIVALPFLKNVFTGEFSLRNIEDWIDALIVFILAKSTISCHKKRKDFLDSISNVIRCEKCGWREIID